MISEQDAIDRLPAHLADVFDVPRAAVEVVPSARFLDLAVVVSGLRFDIEYKGRADVGTTLTGLRALNDGRLSGHPLLVVPFMGSAGATLCKAEGVSWMDLSGNAHIIAPGVRIILKGFPNKYVSRGRPSNAFAPKSARVTRALLHRAPEPISQAELASATGLGTGFVSRIVRKLDSDGLVRRSKGSISVPDPHALLAAWHERYDLAKSAIRKGHIGAASATELMKKLHEVLAAGHVPHAFTGMASAWLRDGFARFRLVTLYTQPFPDAQLMDSLRFREGDRGANTWFIQPGDPMLFDHTGDIHGLPCASALQTYLDLKHLPERSDEAAAHIRAHHLNWPKS